MSRKRPQTSGVWVIWVALVLAAISVALDVLWLFSDGNLYLWLGFGFQVAALLLFVGAGKFGTK